MKIKVCAISLFVFAGSAAANLSARPVIVELVDQKIERADILIGNTGERTQYLTVTPMKIVEPGLSPEQYLRSPDPSEIGLLVAPRRLVLQPQEEKLIRIILLDEHIETDLAWRVRIEPVIGEISSSQPVAVTSIAYDALVFARPSKPVANIIGQRDGNELTVRNDGTTNALLHSGEQCVSDTECVSIAGKRLWPGMSWTINLEHPVEVGFIERGPRDERNVVF